MTSQADISVELSAYLDGQLPRNVAKWVDRAVIENPDLARQLHDLRRVRTILRSLEPAKPKQDFVAKVIAEAKRRGLMRQVVRERMVQGIFRLASAAAAVLLVAVVAGVALQSFLSTPAPPGTLSGRTQQAPIVAAPDGAAPLAVPGRGGVDENEDRFVKDANGLPMGRLAESSGKAAGSARPIMKSNGKLAYERLDSDNLRKNLGVALGQDYGYANTLNLSVEDLGAGAKEVETVLASAGIVRTAGGGHTIAKLTDFDACGFENGAATRGRKAAPAKPAPSAPHSPQAPSAQPGPGQREIFYRAPGGAEELRFVIVAKPEQIAALTCRLGDLRLNEEVNQSLGGLCAAKVARPGADLPKPVSAPRTTSTAAEPKPKSRPTTEPYHIADLQRLANNSQLSTRQKGTGTAPTSQVAQQANRGLGVLIITVRLRPPSTNRVDPARNISQ